MRENWSTSFARVLLSEGGFKLTNIPGDRGGMTYAGIARNKHPDWAGWPMIMGGKLPSKDMVADFYRAEYWTTCRCDDLPGGVDYAVFDFAVNAGRGRAIKLLQQAVGVADDGVIGPMTLAAVRRSDAKHTLDNFSAAKSSFYKRLVDADPSQAKFFKGWMNRVAAVQSNASEMMAA